MFNPDQYAQDALQAGCVPDQIQKLIRAGIRLQPRQLAASAAARLCDHPAGPTAIGYGGARGGGKTHWLFSQLGADDCQRVPGLKCLLLRKVGKSNLENFAALGQRLFATLPHGFNASRGLLTFANGSQIILGHYQCEKDIDTYLGLEYDVIGIEEATQLTQSKYNLIRTCLRTSKPNWRPRLYTTANPGGVGHDWYYKLFILPHERAAETDTRFIPARVEDNQFINPEYKNILDQCTGWQREAWRDGNWNIAAGGFFNTFRHEVHVIRDFDRHEHNITEWVAGMDYGFTHYTVVLLAARAANGNLIIVDEHAERNWIPQRHAQAIKAMGQRHQLFVGPPNSPGARHHYDSAAWCLRHIFAGADCFSTQPDGGTLAKQFHDLGLRLHQANPNRVQGWAEILQRLGDPEAGIPPTLFIHQRCQRLIDCLPYLQHDRVHPADVLKTNVNEEDLGGDDVADPLRYLVTGKLNRIHVVKLCGL